MQLDSKGEEPEYRAVKFHSLAYEAMVDLRYRLLRAPLGLTFSPAELEKESAEYHLGAFVNDRLVACLVLNPIDRQTVKMRQMAVNETYQKQGIGKDLVRFAEQTAMEAGYRVIELHARMHAVKFYEKAGYCRIGDIFLEVTIPHLKMLKDLKQ